MRLNEKKICFIICVNDDLFFSECIRYINNLEKPSDMVIEIAEVRNAASMTSGYNEGLQSSDAKYKVYMHQDVFIRNKYFIFDILDIFRKDDNIGLIGLVGSPVLPSNAVMWYSERCSTIDAAPGEKGDESNRYRVEEDGYWEVEAVDGLLMATQYDIRWREDLFDGWDYYDISHCFEMKRQGYKIAVPGQQESWYIHDDKKVINLWNHNRYRHRFLEEYGSDMKACQKKRTNKEHFVTILIVAHNEIEELQLCISSIRKFANVDNLQIVIIDNASVDGTAEWLSEQEDIAYGTEDSEKGYAEIINTAIELFGIEGDLLLMRPQFAITKGCISRMYEGLYNEEKIGAIGPLTNMLDGSLHNYESAVTYAQNNDKLTMKHVVGILPHIIFIKEEAMKRVGRFDEQISSEKMVIQDYLLRILKEGMTLMSVQNAVAYCMIPNKAGLSSDISMITRSQRRMKEKWGMNYFNIVYNPYLIEMIVHPYDSPISVLEVGCDCGATLVEIKNRWPDASVYGYEINPSAAKVASSVVEVEIGNIEEQKFPYRKEQFDYIIFGDVLEHLRDPEAAIKYCIDYLKQEGCIIASIPNLMHVSVIKELLAGNFTYTDTGLLDRTHIHMFTCNEIERMFTACNYNIEELGQSKLKLSEDDTQYINRLLELEPKAEFFMFETFQYLVRAKKNMR